MEPFIGQILLFAFPRVPDGWLACDGSEVNTADYPSLFELLGTTYGGDGVTSFRVPDLRGRVPLHYGQGTGLTMRAIGQTLGSENVALTSVSLPTHTHALQAAGASPAPGATGMPGPNVGFAAASGVTPYTATPSGAASILAAQSIAAAGGGQSHDNMMPTLVMNYCIAYDGIYPTQG